MFLCKMSLQYMAVLSSQLLTVFLSAEALSVHQFVHLLHSIGGFTVSLGNLPVFVATRAALGVLKLTKQNKHTKKDE